MEKQLLKNVKITVKEGLPPEYDRLAREALDIFNGLKLSPKHKTIARLHLNGRNYRIHGFMKQYWVTIKKPFTAIQFAGVWTVPESFYNVEEQETAKN
jgi:hypothetical protein